SLLALPVSTAGGAEGKRIGEEWHRAVSARKHMRTNTETHKHKHAHYSETPDTPRGVQLTQIRTHQSCPLWKTQ
ncbi:G polyprotein, partial [Dissostichus eleginoides]